jgi:DNA-binding transcriptional ArsR family regulator
MAFSKSKLYPEETQVICGYFRSFGHPARVQIIEQLTENGTSSVQELSSVHPLSQSTFSLHMGKLTAQHLVDWEEKYPNTFYRTNDQTIEEARRHITAFLDRLNRKS